MTCTSMTCTRPPFWSAALALPIAALVIGSAQAADYPEPKQADWIAHNFKFHTGEVMPELRLHYTTIGEPSGEPVLVLHGTGGSAAHMLTAAYAGELFGAGQPLDAKKCFIILTDSVGHGKSSKPSDGLKMKFPHYDYDDMVEAQYRLLTEGLGIRHLRLVTGNSMGGMETWVWGETHPQFMDALVPMASQPTPMAGRNWMLRRLMLEMLRNDPEWQGGNYTTQPQLLHIITAFFGTATSGGTLAYQDLAPSHEAADRMVDERLKAPFTADANDFLYQWGASADYDPAPNLERIEASVLAINAADDERNPPETGITQRALRRLGNARLYLIPESRLTRGHGTTGMAKFYAHELAEFLASTPHRGM
jgi:homoserine O-acetyltransferase/O-succinyltransferase